MPDTPKTFTYEDFLRNLVDPEYPDEEIKNEVYAMLGTIEAPLADMVNVGLHLMGKVYETRPELAIKMWKEDSTLKPCTLH